MHIGWWAADNLDNEYCGKDGGTSYRHPLLSELNQRGHAIWKYGPDPGNYPYTESALDDLGILDEAYRFRDSLDFVLDAQGRIGHLDMLVVELRSVDFFREFRQQQYIINQAHDTGIPVLGFDRNNWGTDLSRDMKQKIHLLRPYFESRTDEAWRDITFFPYPIDTDYWPQSRITPRYDLVYVGNRYGREAQMDAFLDGLEDLDILVAGNWPDRDQDVTDKYPHVDFVGSTPHFSTIPLLQLGWMTFHVGKPDYHDIGMFTPRLVEAALANRVCGVWHEHDYLDWLPDKFVVEDNDDVRRLLRADVVEEYRENLWTTTVNGAATELECKPLA
jgi:hypothetical protein